MSAGIHGDSARTLVCDVIIDPISPPRSGFKKHRSKLKHFRRKDRTARSSEYQDLEDAPPPPPPLPPRTMDMLIPATVSRTSTAGTESTTATGSIFGDDSTTGTPTNAHSHMITFTTMVGHVSSEDVGSVRQFLHAPMKCICWNTATQKGELPVLITFQVQMIRQETASFWKHTLQREVAILSPCQHGLKMLRQRWTET